MTMGIDERVEILRAIAPEQTVDVKKSKALGERARLTLAGARVVKFAYLDGNGSLQLRLHVADTLTQARAFYSDNKALNAVKSLGEEWTLTTNFHFGFMAKGLVWASSSIPVDEYVDYWRRRIGELGEWERPEWDVQLDDLITNEIMDRSDLPAFDAAFRQTRRQTASPRPGLTLIGAAPPGDAESVAKVVAERLQTGLVALSQPHDFIRWS